MNNTTYPYPAESVRTPRITAYQPPSITKLSPLQYVAKRASAQKGYTTFAPAAAVYTAVAELLSRAPTGKAWTWRYMQSIDAGKLKPSKAVTAAIEWACNFLQGRLLHTVSACSCGDVHTYDCAQFRSVLIEDTKLDKPAPKRSRHPTMTTRQPPAFIARFDTIATAQGLTRAEAMRAALGCYVGEQSA